MTITDQKSKLAIRVHTPRLAGREAPAASRASEARGVWARACVPVAGTLVTLLVGAVAGCQGSAPGPSPNEGKPAQAVVKSPAAASPSSEAKPVEAEVKRSSAPAPSSNDRDAIEAVVRGFLKAQKEHDRERSQSFLTAKAKTKFAELSASNRSEGLLLGATYQLGEPVITGDTAQIPVTFREAGTEQKGGLKLRREGGKWGIFAQSGRIIPDDPASEIVMNFEEPEAMFGEIFGGKPGDMAKTMEKNFKDSFDRANKSMVEGKPERGDLAVEALDSISRDQFDASWKVDSSSKGRPAGELLIDLAKAIGRALETTPIQDRALARPVATEVRGLSRYQAIDAVTRAAGLSPVYPEPVSSFDFSTGANSVQATMRLRPRRGGELLAFAGPFLVEVVDVKEAVPYATGILTLKVTASGLSPIVLNELERGTRDAFSVTEVVDAKGHSLVDAEAAGSGAFMSTTIPGGYERTTRLALKGLLRDVAAIKALRCKLRVPLPARVETIRFDTLVAGETRKLGDLEFTLRTATKGQSMFNGVKGESQNLSIEFHRTTPDRTKQGEQGKQERPTPVSTAFGPDRVKLVGHDAQGQPLKTAANTFQRGASDWTSQVNIQGPATSLIAKVVREVNTLEYEFMLADIPLPSHGSMPERIEPASFPGHDSPVAIEFVSIGGKAPFQTAELRVTNHSSKDIRTLAMKFDYLAPDGKRLGGWDNVNQSGTGPSFGSGPGEAKPILVARGAKSAFQVNAPFLTAGTKTIAVTVKTVGFADAETWRPPAAPKK